MQVVQPIVVSGIISERTGSDSDAAAISDGRIALREGLPKIEFSELSVDEGGLLSGSDESSLSLERISAT